MTTTLRPREPVRRTGENRRRTYDICVDGRPVGELTLSAGEGPGPRNGRVERLSVTETDRRRGRATVAALAAEEVLREWGCARVEVSVPATSPGALCLATALGYRERNRTMLKELTREPDLPAGSAPRPMTAADHAGWRERDLEKMIRRMTEDGLPPDRARARAEEAQRGLLPDGPRTPGMALSVLAHQGTDVGMLWLRLDGAPRPGADAWVYAVETYDPYRGQGHGRTLMQAAERACLGADRRTLGLNVFADNVPACSLYTSLGYRTTETHLVKPLR